MPKQQAKQSFLSPGVPTRSRGESYHKKGLWAIKAKNGGQWPAPKPKKITKPWALVEKKLKNGKSVRVVRPRKLARNFENNVKRTPNHRNPRPARVRSSLIPGRVCIILTGKHQGRRAVVVKVLASGLVALTGPSKLNEVHLRRVDPAYLIATSTAIDMTEVNKILASKENVAILNDKLFEKKRSLRPKKERR